MTTDPNRAFLRHVVATLAYRCAKALRGAPAEFAQFEAGETTRTPVEILAHMGDLLDWVLALAREGHVYRESAPLPWDEEQVRFHRALGALDDFLAGDAPLATPAEKLFQGGLADALTHTGQLAMLRRMQGAPMKGESYARADIVAGRVGPEQTPAEAKYEFD
ncbi:MAG: hypothetical protein ABIP29_07740 [Candidatus Eisenbacteria bacterium]